jgi:DNA-binding protein YbaB
MFKQMGEMMSLLKNAREMQTRMEAMQRRLEEMRLSAESADGSIRVTASGVGEILSIDCHPPTDAVGRLDEIRDLVNDALRQAKERHMEEMKTVTGDVDLPGMQDALKKLSG